MPGQDWNINNIPDSSLWSLATDLTTLYPVQHDPLDPEGSTGALIDLIIRFNGAVNIVTRINAMPDPVLATHLPASLRRYVEDCAKAAYRILDFPDYERGTSPGSTFPERKALQLLQDIARPGSRSCGMLTPELHSRIIVTLATSDQTAIR